MNIYDPEKYTAEIFKYKQEAWVKKIEDTLLELMELFHSVDDDLTPETKAEFEQSFENLNNLVATYLLSYNTKVLSINHVPNVQRQEVANEATVAITFIKAADMFMNVFCHFYYSTIISDYRK